VLARKSRGEKKTMIIKKIPIDPGRVRGIPPDGFSWIDRRFVREGFIDRLPGEAILLYFFLAAVSDAQGLSFYADPTVGKILKLDPEKLTQSRARLIKADLVAYRYPLYQVLELPRESKGPPSPPPRPSPSGMLRGGEPMSLGEILRRAGAEELLGKERR
jgi:hypothetical protein